VAELRCPGCDRLVEFEASGSVRVVWDRLSDGRYVGRAIGSADTFDIIDGELDFSWTADMKPRTTWILHECSYGGGTHDRAVIIPKPPGLVAFADEPDALS
jgi:hypothetical protein